ncbi:MAPEG family protein [Fodinicurvata sp. EGI_FJ10296]|uniref:MAPEG family protein n=1 Tax=Fodinicurvata sp. EGI_FJ10296 TaxID=3231908 RepID=UPI003455E756
MALTVTALYAALSALLLLAYAGLVIPQRYRARVGIGDGKDAKLARAIRIHGNAAEYIPICLILIGLLEAGGAPTLALHGLGIALIAGRVAHAVGLWKTDGQSIGRGLGMVLTWLVMIVGAVWNLAYWMMA